LYAKSEFDGLDAVYLGVSGRSWHLFSLDKKCFMTPAEYNPPLINLPAPSLLAELAAENQARMEAMARHTARSSGNPLHCRASQGMIQPGQNEIGEITAGETASLARRSCGRAEHGDSRLR
jgi:hypothetical protein